MIYLDHAAATPVSKKALESMLPFFTDTFFNPSAAYLPAKNARESFESSKTKIANFIGAKSADLIITSGATEANSLAFTSINPEFGARTKSPKNQESKVSKTSPLVLVLSTEHASVLENAKVYPYDLISVDKNGSIDLEDFKKKLTSSVQLVSVSLANNELGTIQPISTIAEIIRDERLRRLKNGDMAPLFLHSDASQGLSLLDINVARLGVDLLTLNSAKVSGPKGVGALYVAHHVKLHPLLLGGGQERGLRSGTENVALSVGFATALESLKNHTASERKKYTKLVENLKKELDQAKIKPLYLGNSRNQLSNFLPVSFPGLDAERLVYKLEEREVYVSTGAACAASKGEPSHVLKAIGLSPEEIAGSLRLSLGVLNNEENVKTAGKIIREVVDSEYVRLYGC
ncbi:cysteine desulfurase [Candidatus Saccharibacteria bacterium]|nr:cysteine desulfurase [Candidatus Saccharibacteria bacterium]